MPKIFGYDVRFTFSRAKDSVTQGKVEAPPTVTSIHPQTGSVEGGDLIVIKGTNFKDPITVFFGGRSIGSHTVNSDTEITTFSPAGTGTVEVTVGTPSGTSASNNATRFTYRGPEHSYYAALVTIAPLMPALMAIFTVAAYILLTGPLAGKVPDPDHEWVSLYIGVLSGLVVWLSGSLLYYRFGFTAADGANVRSYGDLCETLRKLDVQLNGSCLEQRTEPRQRNYGEECVSKEKCASREACSWRDAARGELTKGGLQWVLGTGYVNMYSLTHRAEAALIESEDDTVAIRDGLDDELRLQGSDIPKCEDLLAKLRRAVKALDPQAAGFLIEQPSTGKELSSKNGPSSNTDKISKATAKSALRTVRSTIDGYRDSNRDGLVRARNRFMWVVALFGFAIYFVVALAVANGVPTEALLAATAFYLVGATVGLFSRLYSESSTHSDVDDFGLNVAGLLALPLLSGTSAVLGVFITAVLITLGVMGPFLGAPAGAPGATPPPPTVTATITPTVTLTVTSTVPSTSSAPGSLITPPANVAASVPAALDATSTPTLGVTATLTPTPTPTPAASKGSPDLSEVLENTYSLESNPAGLLYAAMFGLAPNLLIGTIQQQITKYKEQLKSSGPSDQTGKE